MNFNKIKSNYNKLLMFKLIQLIKIYNLIRIGRDKKIKIMHNLLLICL